MCKVQRDGLLFAFCTLHVARVVYQSSSGCGTPAFVALGFFGSPAPAAASKRSASSWLISPGFFFCGCSWALPSFFFPFPLPDFGCWGACDGFFKTFNAIPRLYLASSSWGLLRRLSL